MDSIEMIETAGIAYCDDAKNVILMQADRIRLLESQVAKTTGVATSLLSVSQDAVAHLKDGFNSTRKEEMLEAIQQGLDWWNAAKAGDE